MSTERLPDVRLAEIRAEIEDDSYGHSYDGGQAARELLAEVDRFRALDAFLDEVLKGGDHSA